MKPILLTLSVFLLIFSCKPDKSDNCQVFEIQEITLFANHDYQNPYTEVECWVELQGPDFHKKIYGFWDGDNIFKIRLVATRPGEWKWESGSNQPNDSGLNNQKGSFNAMDWTEQEKAENPNRRGFIKTSPNGHALQYSDGTPFFSIGDTWWAASTWRYPFKGIKPIKNWEPSPENLSFENVLEFRKQQGYNSVAMIACYPNWDNDKFPAQYKDENGIGIRQAWEKWGTPSAKDMHDENGNKPFELSENPPMANYNKINPGYFQSLDKKMNYLAQEGFVPFLETVRRDHGPSWKAYFDWPGSFTRYIQYIVARYGAYNLIFSPLHLDWIPPIHSLSANEFNEAINSWHEKYGPLPYNQPVTTLINGATHVTFGGNQNTPWLTLNSVGNGPRNHGFYPWLEEQFTFNKPTANLEPYYPGWNNPHHNNIVGEIPEPGSDRDNYFGRTQAWGSVLSGGLAGHIYGTGGYCGSTVGEEKGKRLFIWEALHYPAGE